MEDIELVIKIPEKLYTEYLAVQLGRGNGKTFVHTLLKAIKEGTPLPKGHGRLIDANKAIREENSKLVDFDTINTKDRSYCRYARMILNDAPTIIAPEIKKKK